MADPVSIALGVIGVIQAANKAQKAIGKVLRLKEAPQRLEDLYNEVTELETLASLLKRDVAPRSSLRNDDAVIRLNHLLKRAENIIAQAMEVIEQKLIKDPSSLEDDSKKVEIRSFRWLLEEGNINTLTARLSEVKQSLQAAMSAIGVVELFSVTLQVRNIDNRLYDMQEAFIEITDAQASAGVPAIVESSRSQQPLQLMSSSWESSAASEVPQEGLVAPNVGERLLLEGVVFEARQPDLCNCDCHSQLAINTPQWLGSTLGTLRIRYNRDPRSCRNCASKGCGKGTNSKIKYNYYFPQWLLRHAMYLQFNYTPWQGHTISLKMPRVIAGNSPVFSFAQHDNIDAMKRLFEEGLASPFDVSYEEGRSALHYAVTAQKPDMVKFLLQQHADPEAEDNNSLTAYDVVWNYFLQNPGDAFHEDFLTTMNLSREDPETLTKRKFSVAHKIVLGLSNLDLEEFLRAAPEEIDRPDQLGRTPLSWAASRPNPTFVEILLQHGASLYTADRRRQTPIHYCAGSGHAYSMELLLKAAKERSQNERRRRPSQSHSLLTVSDVINAKDSKGRTPLNFATRMNFPMHVRLLIDAQADAEAPDEPLKRTIVLTAVYWNSHRVLPILLQTPVRTNQSDACKATILHYAARYANTNTLDVLLQHDLDKIDILARDDSGLTALETFESEVDRVESETEYVRTESAAKFREILTRQAQKTPTSGHVVAEDSDTDTHSDVSGSVDDFYDADSN